MAMHTVHGVQPLFKSSSKGVMCSHLMCLYGWDLLDLTTREHIDTHIEGMLTTRIAKLVRWLHLQVTTPLSSSARLVSQPSVVHSV